MQKLTKRDFRDVPAVAALEETYDATISATAEITFNTAAKVIEVCSTDKGTFMKWGTGDAVSTDFDAFIPANTCKIFAIPIDTSTGLLYTAANFIEESATAHLVVLEF